MKFLDESDQIETQRLADAEGLTVEDFIKRRQRILGRVNPLLKDKRSQWDTKRNWRNNRNKMMKGIKRFHKSTAGKQYHRKLGRFLSDRASAYGKGDYGSNPKQKEEYWEDIVALNSFKTHLVLENSYFIPDFDTHLSFNQLFENAYPMLNDVIESIEKLMPITEDHINMLTDLCKETFHDDSMR